MQQDLASLHSWQSYPWHLGSEVSAIFKMSEMLEAVTLDRRGLSTNWDCSYVFTHIMGSWNFGKKKEILKKRLLGLHCLLPSCINLVHHRVAFGIPLPSTGLQTNGIPKTWLLKSTAKDFSKDFISYFIICNIWNRMVILLKILTPTTYNKIQSNLASSNILQRVTLCIQDWNFQQFLKRLKCLKELFL